MHVAVTVTLAREARAGAAGGAAVARSSAVGGPSVATVGESSVASVAAGELSLRAFEPLTSESGAAGAVLPTVESSGAEKVGDKVNPAFALVRVSHKGVGQV